MKILFILGGLRFGGYEVLNVRIANELVNRGIESEILSLSDNKDIIDSVSEGVDLFFLKRGNKFDLSIIYKIRKLLKKSTPDVILCCDFLEYLFSRIASTFLKPKPVFIYAFHITKPPIIQDHRWNKILSGIDSIYKDSKIAIHNSQIDFYHEEYSISKDKFNLIHNGINTDYFKPGKNKQYFKNDIIRLVHVASLKPLKDQWTLLKAMVELNKTVNNWELKIAGADVVGLKIKYEKFVRDNELKNHVEFLGPVKDVKSLLAKSDLFLLTSTTEALPMSIMEANAMGLPAIVTRVGGCPEIIEDGKQGYLVNVGDYSSIAEKIVGLINNPDLLKQMGKNAHIKIEKEFSFNIMIEKYIELFRDVAN